MQREKRIIISNKKLRGEWAELVFMVCAAEHGLQISKPWGEMRSYDFVVGRPGHFVAVQVKSTICELGAGYACTVRGGHSRKYAPGSFDFLAAYVVLDDSWYIIPAEVIEGRGRVSLSSDSERAHYEEYREAWELLGEGDKVGDIQACAEDLRPAWIEPAENRPETLSGKIGALVDGIRCVALVLASVSS
jgi:hypothetical protein